MKPEHVEAIAIALYEIDRQKGQRTFRWYAGAESKRERYRAKARALLADENFKRLAARLEERYRHTGQVVYKTGLAPTSTRH